VPVNVTLARLAPLANTTLLIVALASVMLLRVVIVLPRYTDVFPITIAVEKLVSSCDNGIDPVALANV
jgi:hypothetical protein